MKGYDVYKKAILRLGYNDSANERLLERGLEFINQISADLNLAQIKSLSDEIAADKEGIEAICCGAAMLLSLSEGDGSKNKLFADIYNAKRAKVLATSATVKDVLPVAEGGDFI